MNIWKIDKNKKAFTFIEVMIVISIIGIMSAILFAFIGQNKGNAQLESAANEVAADLRMLQNYALGGKDARSGCNVYTFFALGNTYVAGNGNLGSFESCGGIYKQKILNNNISFGTNGGLPLYLAQFVAPFNNGIGNMDIVLRKNSSEYHICLTKTGLITTQKDPCVF